MPNEIFIIFFLIVAFFYIVTKLFYRKSNSSKGSYNSNNSYNVEELKFNDIELINARQNLFSTQNRVNTILKNSSAKEKEEVHRILRSQNPIYKNKPLYSFDDNLNEADLNTELYLPSEYLELLKLKTFDNDDVNNNLTSHGKVVGFQIGLTTIDGAPIAESQGFVDYYDIPPFDTWFYLKDDILLCWIPKEYISLMQGAMDVEIFDAYFWLDETFKTLNDRLMKTDIQHKGCMKSWLSSGVRGVGSP